MLGVVSMYSVTFLPGGKLAKQFGFNSGPVGEMKYKQSKSNMIYYYLQPK